MNGILVRIVCSLFVMVALAVSAMGVVPSVAATSPHSLPGFGYISPAPGSDLHLPQTNIIVRPGALVDVVSLSAETITATGSLSGEHSGTLRLSDDGKTILFLPASQFTYEEDVACTIAPGIRTTTGDELPGAEFTFRIAPPLVPASFNAAGTSLVERLGVDADAIAAPSPARSPGARFDSIPGLPAFQLSVTGPTAPGDLFVSDIRFDNPNYESHLLVLRNDGTPALEKKLVRDGLDFKVQQRRLTYFDGARGYYYAVNANEAVVDSFRPGNGYAIDLHELVLLANGHALLMSYDRQPVDMSAIVDGGNPNAVVVGLVVQELDLQKDVVFQWRSWDHFQITDMTARSLTTPVVDYAHGNSIELDTDGNLFFSSRHLDEITKVSRETGEILWRLGGKNNQFTFVNDPDHFSQQHSARRLANGHLLLYDNGNFHTPPHSRAVEYALDEQNMTATLVWEYRNTPDTYGGAMGSVQRLPNGNTIIGWGATNPTATEVTPAGEKVAELNFPTGTYSYRAFRFEWPPRLQVATRLRGGTVDIAEDGEYATVFLSSDDFGLQEVDYPSLRLAGAVSPAGYSVPVTGPAPGARGGRNGTPPEPPTDEAQLFFLVESLLPLLQSGSQELALTGRLTSGETFTGSVALNVTGERNARARMMSPVGAFPIQLSLRSAGIPRTVVFVAYDVQGRRVARWSATSDAAGVVAWDGRGSDGERLRSGIYFVGTEGSALTERAKVVLVK